MKGAALALGEAPCSAPIAWRTVSVGSIFLGHAAFLCMCGLQMESVDLHGVHVHV